MKRDDEEDTDLFNVPQVDTAEIYSAPIKRTTITGFQAPLPPEDAEAPSSAPPTAPAPPAPAAAATPAPRPPGVRTPPAGVPVVPPVPALRPPGTRTPGTRTPPAGVPTAAVPAPIPAPLPGGNPSGKTILGMTSPFAPPAATPPPAADNPSGKTMLGMPGPTLPAATPPPGAPAPVPDNPSGKTMLGLSGPNVPAATPPPGTPASPADSARSGGFPAPPPANQPAAKFTTPTNAPPNTPAARGSTPAVVPPGTPGAKGTVAPPTSGAKASAANLPGAKIPSPAPTAAPARFQPPPSDAEGEPDELVRSDTAIIEAAFANAMMGDVELGDAGPGAPASSGGPEYGGGGFELGEAGAGAGVAGGAYSRPAIGRPSASGPSASGPSASGPSASGPVTSGPTTNAPITNVLTNALSPSFPPATIVETQGTTSGPPPSPDVGLENTSHRYTLGPMLGRGGMGEVFSALDEQIGRPVAIKRLRVENPSQDALTRFLREARIQGRLEHPAIVPVHELWKDDLGRPFFVMKQLTGITLADVLSRLAVGSPESQKQFSRQRLLRAFADVCLAIEFAHTRGVVHRDLKPANIVLGDFGEVYVLDWGVARVMNEDERPSFTDMGAAAGEDRPYSETAVGSILGTPGYIAPEQIRGESDLDGRADVYALGTILFEILTLYPLHPRGQAAIASALAGVDARPSRRALDRVVPPELDAICVRATAVERTDRYPTARALHDAVQEFLDGDRDFVLRRELARSEMQIARSALVSGNGPRERRIAIRAAARALAFDPTSPQPADMLGRLMLEPPAEIPQEVEQELERADLESLKKSARFGMLAAIAYMLFFPILFWIGFRDAWYHIAGPGLCVFIVAVELAIAPRNPYISGYLAIAANLALLALLSRIVSPFLIGAGPATVIVMLLANHRRLINTWLLAGLCVGATLLPWILELWGVLSPRAFVTGDSFVLRTGAGSLNELAALFGLVLYIVVLIVLATVLSRIQDNERRGVRRNLQIQAWQLRELIPRADTKAETKAE